jgi:uncharacterized membrane protein YdjX (TVP38/TMEM64 family)
MVREAVTVPGSERTWKILGLILVAALLVVVGAFGWTPLRGLLSDPESLRAVVISWGWWGPLALIGLQVAQVLIAPLPGQVLGLVGGYVYGPWLGTLINMVGTLLGSGLAMWLARRLGRPLVQHFVSSQWLDRLDGLAVKRGAAVFFLIFLLPFLPDDAACFVAGLSPLPLKELLLLAAIGRLPGVFIPNWLGAHAADLSATQWLALVLLLIPLAVAFWHWQETIERWLLRLVERSSGRG